MRGLLKPTMFLIAVFFSMSSMGWAEATITAERLLPKTTKGAVIVTHAQDLVKHWNETQLGQLMADPVMKPFAEDLRRQFQDRWSHVRDRLGLRFDDVRGVPGGEMALALIEPAEGESAVALVMDVTGHLPQAQAMLDKVTANMKEKNAKETRQSAAGTTIIAFDLPQTEEFPAGRVVYFLSDHLLGASDNQSVIEGILKRKMDNAASKDALADLPAFQAVMKRCREHAKGAAPQIRWFVDPLGYVMTVRSATPEDKRRKGVTVVDVMRAQGFTAVAGVGGFVDLMVEGFESLHRTAIYAPKPYLAAPEPYKNKVSMDMFALPNRQDFAPPAWVPGDVAACRTFYWDVLKAFDNFGPTFDQIVGEGQEPGIWEDTLESFRTEPNGPQMDLRAEMLVHLGQRVVTVTDYVLPITTTSERLLFAIEAKDEAAAAAGLRKMWKDDPTIRGWFWPDNTDARGVRQMTKEEMAAKRCLAGGVEIWETVDEPQRHPLPADPLVDLPTMTPKRDAADAEGRGYVQEDEEQLLLPHVTMAVVHGQLMIASHQDYLVEVLSKAKHPDPLAGSLDYQTVAAAMKKLGAGQDCIQSFCRTDETFQPTYELIRLGKMPESETMFGRMLNALLGPHKKGAVRQQQIEGNQMPDYEVVRRRLGPAGVFGVTEPDGWFVVGFTLKK